MNTKMQSEMEMLRFEDGVYVGSESDLQRISALLRAIEFEDSASSLVASDEWEVM